MGELITRPDAKPVVFAILNIFLLGAGGYYVMGQKRKALGSLLITIATTCVGLPAIWIPITAYDAWLLGRKLASGESIGLNENGFEPLDLLFR